MRCQFREFLGFRFRFRFRIEFVSDIVLPAVPRKARGDAARRVRRRPSWRHRDR
jgi:hypothetical protein